MHSRKNKNDIVEDLMWTRQMDQFSKGAVGLKGDIVTTRKGPDKFRDSLEDSTETLNSLSPRPIMEEIQWYNNMTHVVVGSTDMSDVNSFSWIVHSAIRSETASYFGASPAHSFASAVDSMIRSSGASSIRSSRADFETSPSPMHDFASAVYMKGVSARLFSLTEIEVATNNFSVDYKIGAGRCGAVYRGILDDSHEVAIKRNVTWIKNNFDWVSHLCHKNLVSLVGFCEEKDERCLVYEYAKNGSLYDHLHDDMGSSVLKSWKMRIKIALDASKGIEYLHSYTVPSIIHRNIKSSNILIDDTWTARISDFELSFMIAEPDLDIQDRVMGTYEYIDPEYYRRSVNSKKIDVYAFGVVLFELLTGKRAMFKSREDGSSPLSVVDLAVPTIMAGCLVKILDPRVGPPNVNEANAVQLLAYTAIQCVNFKGKQRPTMVDIVDNLERALAICV